MCVLHLFSCLQEQQRELPHACTHTNTHLHTWSQSCCLSECLIIASAGPNAQILSFPFPNTHSHRHTHKITPPLPLQCLHLIAPILNDPKIAQEAIRKDTARGGSSRVLQSTTIGEYQASPSLLFCLFLLSSIPLPAALCSHESLLWWTRSLGLDKWCSFPIAGIGGKWRGKAELTEWSEMGWRVR